MLRGMTAVARLLIGAIFGVAAGAKLVDRRGFGLALTDFGFGPRGVRILAWAVPAVEALVAAGLLIDATAGTAALVGAALLIAFAAAIARALMRGTRPDCNCFGQLRPAQVGWPLLVRNALLAGAAVYVAATVPGDSVPWWLAAAVAALVLRARGARRSAGPRVGAVAPAVAGRDAHGRPASLHDLTTAGLPVALVLVSDECGPCRALVPELERWRPALEGRLALLTVEEGADALGVAATPSALIVAPDGRVASGTASGVAGVEALVRRALASPAAEM